MWWHELELRRRLAWPLRLAVVLVAGGLTAGCWQPLYGSSRSRAAKACRTSLPRSTSRRSSPPRGRRSSASRSACSTRCSSTCITARPCSRRPIKLTVTVSTSQFTSYLDPVTGRPDSSIEWVVASYQLIELTTGKMVLNDIAYAHVSYDIPGSQQRFAGQRARRDAEDRAIVVAADAIRNRLASYFVAGT